MISQTLEIKVWDQTGPHRPKPIFGVGPDHLSQAENTESNLKHLDPEEPEPVLGNTHLLLPMAAARYSVTPDNLWLICSQSVSGSI